MQPGNLGGGISWVGRFDHVHVDEFRKVEVRGLGGELAPCEWGREEPGARLFDLDDGCVFAAHHDAAGFLSCALKIE